MRRLLTFLGVTLTSAAVTYYARYMEPEWLKISRVTVPMPRLGTAFDGYRIAQFSDIHIDNWMTYRRLEDDVEAINEQHPDLIVITGDFITNRVRYSVDDLYNALTQLSAPDGVLAVPGNHDYWQPGEIDKLRQMLRDCGIIDLSNNVHTIKRGDDSLYIAGIDNVIARKARLDLVMEQLPPTGAAILLAHEPDFADISAATHRFDLQLSGHTHGGQIRIPFVGSLAAPLHGHRYDAGMFDIDGMSLYVSRGVGMVTFPLRLNCRPEIPLITLRVPISKMGRNG